MRKLTAGKLGQRYKKLHYRCPYLIYFMSFYLSIYLPLYLYMCIYISISRYIDILNVLVTGDASSVSAARSRARQRSIGVSRLWKRPASKGVPSHLHVYSILFFGLQKQLVQLPIYWQKKSSPPMHVHPPPCCESSRALLALILSGRV